MRESEAQRWLEQAEEDFISAEVLMEAERYYMVCFVAQQIAEKALKAFLYERGEPLVVGHSVEELCRRAFEYEANFLGLGSEISVLDGYYVPTRYPNGLPASIPARVYNKAAGQEALRLARKAVEFVKERVK